MYRNLSEFIARLEREGELQRVSVPVDPVYEIAEITDRMSKQPDGGKALLFEQTGTPFPVLTNMMGSDRRMAMALGVESLDELTRRLDDLLQQAVTPKNSLLDKLRMLPLLAEMSRWLPRTSSSRGECQQVVLQGEEASLDALPVLKCWPCDGGRFVTLPLVHTLDPETGIRNVGMYRLQLFDARTTGMHWHLHKTGARHYEGYRRAGRRMPVSVALGGDPAYTYAATAPMPDNMDEYLLAGFLRRRPVKLVKCITNDIYVPADCDFVIEGYVDPSEPKTVEGPFGDHTGFYSLTDEYPRFHVTAVTRRRDAVYPATLVGIPPQEDAYIAKATEKIFLAPIRLAVQPEVKELTMPVFGTAHNLAVVSIDRRYRGQAHKVAQGLWGAGQMMFNKYLVITGEDCDVHDPDRLAALLRRAEFPRDLIVSEGVYDVLDHATATPGFGGKLAFDLTEIDPSAPAEAVWLPERFELTPGLVEVADGLAGKWGALLLFADDTVEQKPDLAAFLARNPCRGIRYVVLFDGHARTLRPDELLATHMLAENGIREPLYLTAMRYAGIAITPEKRPAHVDTVVLDDADTARLHKWFHALPLPEPDPAPEHLLEVRGLGFGYTKGQSTLHDISFSIGKGEMVSIVGRNGAGKSTLAKLICGFETPEQGQVLLNGRDLAQDNIRRRAQHIGYVMQNPNQMISKTMIFEEVALALQGSDMTQEQIRQRVEDTLKVCGLYLSLIHI